MSTRWPRFRERLINFYPPLLGAVTAFFQFSPELVDEIRQAADAGGKNRANLFGGRAGFIGREGGARRKTIARAQEKGAVTCLRRSGR